MTLLIASLIPFALAVLFIKWPQVAARRFYLLGRALGETSATGRSEMDDRFDGPSCCLFFRRSGYVCLILWIVLVDLGIMRMLG